MRIPDEFVANVNEAINAKKSNFCSKISMEQYECEKSESKQHLIKLLYSILTNVTMTQEDKLKRLKQVLTNIISNLIFFYLFFSS